MLTFTSLILRMTLRGVAGGDGELGCLCGKAGTSHLCDGSAHSSGCVVNGYGCLLYLTLGAHAQRGLWYLSVCVSARSSSYSVRFSLQ